MPAPQPSAESLLPLVAAAKGSSASSLQPLMATLQQLIGDAVSANASDENARLSEECRRLGLENARLSSEAARVQADNLQLREELLQLRNELQHSRSLHRRSSSSLTAGDAAGATPPPRVAVRLRSSAGEEVAASILPTA